MRWFVLLMVFAMPVAFAESVSSLREDADREFEKSEEFSRLARQSKDKSEKLYVKYLNASRTEKPALKEASQEEKEESDNFHNKAVECRRKMEALRRAADKLEHEIWVTNQEKQQTNKELEEANARKRRQVEERENQSAQDRQAASDINDQNRRKREEREQQEADDRAEAQREQRQRQAEIAEQRAREQEDRENNTEVTKSFYGTFTNERGQRYTIYTYRKFVYGKLVQQWRDQ